MNNKLINALVLNNELSNNSDLWNKITFFLPQVSITIPDAFPMNCIQYIQDIKPNLLFLDLEHFPSKWLEILKFCQDLACEIILISSKKNYAIQAVKYRISGYLLKPINSEALKNTMNLAMQRIEKRKKTSTETAIFNDPSVIGVPTMEGYEYLNIQNIIRCESYLKCTRVITSNGSDVVSSYNIGEFFKALEKHGFYAPHQSYLINLHKVKKYLKEGTIIMHDGSVVPVARRRRQGFLRRIPHL